MLALSDEQLQTVMIAAGPLPPEKRSVFLERVGARLQLRGHRFTAADLDDAIRVALTGLIFRHLDANAHGRAPSHRVAVDSGGAADA
jgi:hypothetical protein